MGSIYQRHELEAYLGDGKEGFDIEAIENEATEVDPRTGNRYWKEGVDLAEVCARHDLWRGAGWYRIGFSDGGQDWTSGDPAWFDSQEALFDEVRAARGTETETHLAWCEYMGDGEEPMKD